MYPAVAALAVSGMLAQSPSPGSQPPRPADQSDLVARFSTQPFIVVRTKYDPEFGPSVAMLTIGLPPRAPRA